MFTSPVYHCLQNGSKILFVRTSTITHQLQEHQQRTLHQVPAPNDVGAPHLRPEHEFKVAKALIVSKLSRLELESHRNASLTQTQLERMIRNRGSDYDSLVYHHHLHKNFQQRVVQSFADRGVEVQCVNRLNLSKKLIQWADILVPIGGDGTFLMSAGRASPLIPDLSHIPVVGFNSDPVSSEGRLLLPKQFSHEPHEAVRKIVEGDFKWVRRSRIRVTMLGENGALSSPIDMHDSNGPIDCENELQPEPLSTGEAKKYDSKMRKLLPFLALNEVFMGETMSARVSHMHILKDDDAQPAKTKSSGLCVSTGTGSTSWLTSINRLAESNVEKLMEIITARPDNPMCDLDVKSICDEYNKCLLFPADDPRMCYSIREQICVGVWPNPKGFKSRGFCRSMLVTSRCMDASLVIDGSVAYAFNDGAKALLTLHPDDSLLTMSINATSAAIDSSSSC